MAKMKKTFDGIQAFLIVAVSVFILALPAYLHYTRLSQIKLISADLGFENSDQEGGLAGNEKESKVYGSTAFLMVFLLGRNLVEYFPRFFQALSLQQGIVVLRC